MAEWTLEDFAKAHKPARATARVGFRQDLWDRHARLEAELAQAIREDSTQNRDPEAPAVADELKALEAQIEAGEQAFTFQSIGKAKWTALIAEHPPLPEHKDMGSDHNPDTFPPAAMAACAVEPTMTVETAQAMADALNVSQWNRLWSAVLTANLGGGEAPKSAMATVVQQRLAPSSTTAVPEESLAASS
jgi:hypothetical protein